MLLSIGDGRSSWQYSLLDGLRCRSAMGAVYFCGHCDFRASRLDYRDTCRDSRLLRHLGHWQSCPPLLVSTINRLYLAAFRCVFSSACGAPATAETAVFCYGVIH